MTELLEELRALASLWRIQTEERNCPDEKRKAYLRHAEQVEELIGRFAPESKV